MDYKRLVKAAKYCGKVQALYDELVKACDDTNQPMFYIRGLLEMIKADDQWGHAYDKDIDKMLRVFDWTINEA